MSPLALVLVSLFVRQDDVAFAKAKAALEASSIRSTALNAEYAYKLTDLTSTNFIFRETYRRLDEKDTAKEVIRIKFDQIEAILTRSDAERSKPIKTTDPMVKIVLKSEPEFLDAKTQKWRGYIGEDLFSGVEIVCASYAQSDEIAMSLAEAAKARGLVVPVLKQFDSYQSLREKASAAESGKDAKAEEEKLKKALKAPTKEVREMMKDLVDYVAIFCKGMDDEANDYEYTITAMNDEGFTVRKTLTILVGGDTQTDSITVPWHLIKHLQYNLKPENSRPFVRVSLLRSVKMYRKGKISNDTVDVQTFEIASPADKAMEQIAAWIGYIPFKRGIKVTVQDLARG